MKSAFSSDFFAGNRRRLRESVDAEIPIVVTANGWLQRSSIDSAYPFHQDADFWYLTGIDEPDLILVMDEGEEYLIVPTRPAIREAFDGTVANAPLTRLSGIRIVLDDKVAWERLGERLKKTKQVATPAAAPPYVERSGIYANPARAVLAAKLRSYNRKLKLVDLRPQLTDLRVIKQPPELKVMQTAIDITIASLKEVLKPTNRRTYRYEYEIEAEITRGFRRRGATGHSFGPIVAGGERACTLHNIANDSALKPDELVIIDVGAEVEHYAADITRTISLRVPSRRQQAVHEAVLETQHFALGLLKPGVLLKDYERQVREYLGGRLRDLGLVKTVNLKSVRKFYPHGTSHFLGLDVHDAGDFERPLKPGMVITCEPGIYIPEEGIGVRIEDDVLITKTGNKVLSAELPKDL